MKTIGLLGGMSWESTALYYRWINEEFRKRLGELHSAPIALVSVDFQEIKELQAQDRWDEAGDVLAKASQRIEAAGADFLLICTNTMHKVVPRIEQEISIPILHIADAVADEIKSQGVTTVGFLGTKFTMTQPFCKSRLVERGLNVIVPDTDDCQEIHRIIFDELCAGIIKDESRCAYLDIMDRLKARGAEGIVEGCTEIVMLVKQDHTELPLFDTTAIHVQAAVDWCFDGGTSERT